MTLSQQKVVDKIGKNHKTEVEVSDIPGTDGCISMEFTFNDPGIYHGRKVSRVVTKRGRIIR